MAFPLPSRQTGNDQRSRESFFNEASVVSKLSLGDVQTQPADFKAGSSLLLLLPPPKNPPDPPRPPELPWPPILLPCPPCPGLDDPPPWEPKWPISFSSLCL